MSEKARSCDEHQVPHAAHESPLDESPFEDRPFELRPFDESPFELIPLDESPFTLRPFELMPFLLMSSCTRGSNAGSPATDELQLQALPAIAARTTAHRNRIVRM